MRSPLVGKQVVGTGRMKVQIGDQHQLGPVAFGSRVGLSQHLFRGLQISIEELGSPCCRDSPGSVAKIRVREAKTCRAQEAGDRGFQFGAVQFRGKVDSLPQSSRYLTQYSG